MPDVDLIKTPETDVVPPEDTQEELTTDETPEEPAKPDESVELLKKIDQKLTPREPAGPTPDQIYRARRESLKEKFNWDDSQVDAYEADKAESMAPIKEELAWTKLKSEASNLTPEIEDEMKEELKQYPAHLRGDKVLLEKVYYMALGKRTSLNKHVARKEAPNGAEEDVVSRRVMSSTGGSSVSVGSTTPSKGIKITEEERKQARRNKMSDEEWVRYRDDTIIENFRKQ